MDSAVIAVTVADVKPTVLTKVQLVNRTSSEELLRKFADPEEDDKEEKKKRKPRKRMKKEKEEVEESIGSSMGFLERKRLLSPPLPKRRSHLSLRQRSSHLRNRSLLTSIRKTWRRTVEGASRVFIDKHYNSHRRLISDVV